MKNRIVGMSRRGAALLVALLLAISSWPAPVQALPLIADPDAFAKAYLRKFRYTDEASGDLSMSSALRKLQNEIGLDETGVLDQATLYWMQRPRCGTPQELLKRHKRFVTSDGKWKVTKLTYKLIDPYDKMTELDQFHMRNVLRRSFHTWSEATDGVLKFEEKQHVFAIPDILVYFADGDHNDTLPFDGRNGVVAHGFYPTDGNLHFDASEDWTLDVPYGINLFQTAVHEIGHLLGLEHSKDWRAVMYPINQPYNPDFQLSQDDITGIQWLYPKYPSTICWRDFDHYDTTDVTYFKECSL